MDDLGPSRPTECLHGLGQLGHYEGATTGLRFEELLEVPDRRFKLFSLLFQTPGLERCQAL